MRYYNEGRIHAKIWSDDIEESAIDQIKNLCDLPFAFHHVAVMPDAHMGYGMPIGGVLATKDVIIPNAVGVDIGCGMVAVNLLIPCPPVDKIKEIMGNIRKRIPVGFNSRDTPLDYEIELPEGYSHLRSEFGLDNEKTRKQVGTLGGGNHFIELQQDENGNLWAMIHSGSRNLGKRVCDYYNEKAVELNAKWHTSVPAAQELAFLPSCCDEYGEYIVMMRYCMSYAKLNREMMMYDVIESISAASLQLDHVHLFLDTAHNYAAEECHYGSLVWVHRKGAVSADEGVSVIIPGSQGTKSYIARGLGNENSFNSCSHGAGRKMSRSAASKTLDLQQQVKILNDQGIVHGIRTEKDLDEAPGAYKDIKEVMENQKDLVEIITELTPVGVIKG